MLKYIRTIREKVGHDLVMTVGCGAIVEDETGRILLQRRRDSGLWAIPGGLVEPGEYLEEAMRREIAEETGLDIDTAGLFGVYSGPEGFGDYPNGDRIFSIQIVFHTVTVHPVLHQSYEESLDFAFFARGAFVAEGDMHRH